MNWIEAAKKAKTLLPEELGYGAKQKAMAAVAEQLGFSRQSLGNILVAYRFLQSVYDDPGAYRALSSLPYSAVEIYCRWAAYDRSASFAHAEKAALESLSVKSVIAAEKAARSFVSETSEPWGRVIVEMYQDNTNFTGIRFAKAIDEHLGRLHVARRSRTDWSWKTVDDSYSVALGIRDALTFFDNVNLRESDNGKWPDVVGILEVGVRPLAEGYRKLGREVMARAVAATVAYPVVLVVAPDLSALKEIYRSLPSPFTRAGEPTAWGHLHVLGDGMGGVVFTAPETMFKDLHG